MKKKIFCIALILLAFIAIGTVFAQSISVDVWNGSLLVDLRNSYTVFVVGSYPYVRAISVIVLFEDGTQSTRQLIYYPPEGTAVTGYGEVIFNKRISRIVRAF